jgi:hypothetical protein
MGQNLKCQRESFDVEKLGIVFNNKRKHAIAILPSLSKYGRKEKRESK